MSGPLDVWFDPVAGELGVSDGRGACVFTAQATEVVVKHYLDDGILYFDARGEVAALAFYDLANHPVHLRLEATEGGSWRVLPANA